MDKILADPRMQSFIEIQQQKSQFNLLVHDLTEKCWDLCMDRPSTKLGPKTETCISNCVERFIDSNVLLTKKMDNNPKLNQIIQMDMNTIDSI